MDGTVRPENDITRSEVAAIFFRLLTDSSRSAWRSQTNSYSDVSADAWYNNAVSTLSNAGVITGYTDGTFRPDQPITRAEAITMINRVLDRDVEQGNMLGNSKRALIRKINALSSHCLFSFYHIFARLLPQTIVFT